MAMAGSIRSLRRPQKPPGALAVTATPYGAAVIARIDRGLGSRPRVEKLFAAARLIYLKNEEVLAPI